MKKAFYILALIFAAYALSSCDEKGTPDNGSVASSTESSTSNPLYGTWKLTAYFTASYDEEPFANEKLSRWTGVETSVILSEGGRCLLAGYFGSSSCQYRLENSVLELYVEKGPIAYFDVISLTDKEMVLRMESSYYYKFDKTSSSDNALNSLKGTWAMSESGKINNHQSGGFILWIFDTAQFRERYIHGTYEDGVMLNSYETDDDKAKNNKSVAINYTYKNGKISYSGTEASVIVEDNDHIIINSLYFARIKDFQYTNTPPSTFSDPDMVDLSKYNPQDDPSCWAITAYQGSTEATSYYWSNEYFVAAGCKAALEMVGGASISYSWKKVDAANEQACEDKNAD